MNTYAIQKSNLKSIYEILRSLNDKLIVGRIFSDLKKKSFFTMTLYVQIKFLWNNWQSQ
jgi:hypothetical protein